MYEKAFYTLLFGVHFIQELDTVIKKDRGLNSTLSGILDTRRISESLRKAFQGVEYRRRNAESNFTDMSKVVSFHSISTYRRRLSKIIFAVVERSLNIGIMRVPFGIGNYISYAEIQMPFWLSPGILDPSIFDDVHYNSRIFQDKHRVPSTPKSSFRSGRRTLSDVGKKRVVPGREISRRLSQKEVNQLNKLRGSFCTAFFVNFGFILALVHRCTHCGEVRIVRHQYLHV